MDWQPARVISTCGVEEQGFTPELAAKYGNHVVRIKPSPLPCEFCGGRAFTIHPEDAVRIHPDHAPILGEVYACEKDILTD